MYRTLSILFLLILAVNAIASPSQALSVRADHLISRATNGSAPSEEGPVNQTESTCRQVNVLMFLVQVADDPDKKQKLLNAVSNQTAAEAALATAPEKLKAFSNDSSLMETCSIIRAGKQLKRSCRRMRVYEELSKASANETLKQELLANANNATKLEARIASADEKLMEMTVNSSLVDACESLGGVNKGLFDSGAWTTSVEKITLGLFLIVAASILTIM